MKDVPLLEKPAMLTVKDCNERFAAERQALAERYAAAEKREKAAITRAENAHKWKGRMVVALLTLVAAMVGVKLGFPFFW